MRKQWSLQTGYSNLFDPVIKRHPDFVATVLASVTNNATLVGFIDHKSQTVFCWIDWTTTCNLPFSWCEDGTVTKYTTLARISTEALLKYATLVVREIEIFIGLVIPVKIGIMLDGCTFKSEHVLAVFAVFEPDRRVDKVLLAFAPLIYDDATDHTAASPVKFLKGILPYFNRDVTDIIYLRDENVTLLDVRDIFDALTEHHPVVAKYLAPDASIVKSPDFEDACTKVLLGKDAEPSQDQHELLKPFAAHVETQTSVSNGDVDDRAGFAERVLHARKKQRVSAQVYGWVIFIPPTSNAVELLFSKARHVLSLHRHGILPARLEMLLFMMVNRRFWGAATRSKVVNA
ncbi:hypothetical protein PF002_g14491 [Phytophthora fragariae]|uniref:HAT C-terminal dimerisation domain-containing protein n=1 Tax=Phytophthora fragariae TaxID=53985 RepID=A0A6A3ESB6_9STRA|nr:hypothetical protein PF003_g31923 [Phytophthora fragariae]KAE8936324.1 hypothetical protein PF009_g13748 [Phytophthora fragariae]KAE9225139.1 hypothetical protein PF002_g14491 [Phytophthora fragariae]